MPVYQSSDRWPRFRSTVKYFRKTKVRLGKVWVFILTRTWDRADKCFVYTYREVV